MEKELYKNRSFSACIKAAYVLFSTNLKTILKRTWLPVLIMAVTLTFNTLFNLPDKGIHDLGMAHPAVTATIMALATILSILAEVWILAVIARLLNQKPLKPNFFRGMILMGVSLIITFLVLFIINFGRSFIISFLISSKLATQSTALIAGMGISVLLVLLILIFYVPFVFSTTKYLLDHQTPLSAVFTTDYRRGLHHWGLLFGALFFTGMILIVLSAILLIPFFIIVVAQTINQLGMLDGDPTGVPGYFFWLLIVTTLVTMFIFTYGIIWAQLVAYYAYGSIEAKEELKADEKRKEENTDNLTETVK